MDFLPIECFELILFFSQQGFMSIFNLQQKYAPVCKRWSNIIKEYLSDINKAIYIVNPNFSNLIDLLKLTRIPPTPETVQKLDFYYNQENRKFQVYIETYRPHIWVNIPLPTIEEIEGETSWTFLECINKLEHTEEKFRYVHNLFVQHNNDIIYCAQMFDHVCDSTPMGLVMKKISLNGSLKKNV